MAASKTSASILSAVTTTQTSNPVSTAALYAATVYASLVVVGTPSASATFQIQISCDGTNYYNYGGAYQATLAAGTYQWVIALDPTAVDVQIVFTAQTGGTSGTFTAQLGEVTGI